MANFPVQGQQFDFSKMMSEMVSDRLNKAKAVEQEQKNPFVKRRELAEILGKEIENKYKPRDYETTFAQRGATTNKLKQETDIESYKLKYPGWGEPGIRGELAHRQYLMDKEGPQAVHAREQTHPIAGMMTSESVNSGGAMPLDQSLRERLSQGMVGQPNQPEMPQQSRLAAGIAQTMMPQQMQQPQQPQAPQPQAAQPQQQLSALDILNRSINADMKEKEAKAKYWEQGGNKGGVKMQTMNQLVKAVEDALGPNATEEEVGQATDARLAGEQTYGPDHKPLPPMSGREQQALQNVQSGNAPKALQTQYAQMDILAKDLNDFDIDALSAFTGPKGAADLIVQKGKMALNDPTVDPMARRYFTAIQQAIVNMDQMRKAFGTSIVPKYVYETVGKLTNPNDKMWLDEKQVKANFKATQNVMNRNRDIMKYKIEHGVTAEIPDSMKSPENAKEEKAQTSESGNVKKWKTVMVDGKQKLVEDK